MRASRKGGVGPVINGPIADFLFRGGSSLCLFMNSSICHHRKFVLDAHFVSKLLEMVDEKFNLKVV
jgi:hypothetical protein